MPKMSSEPATSFKRTTLHGPTMGTRWSASVDGSASLDLEALRQATEEFSLTIRDMSELKERIKLLQEEIAAQVSEQTNRSVFTLTMVTVLALPINIVAGLLGMNVGGIPLADHPHGFMVIAGLIGVFTAFAGWYLYRQK